MQEIRKVLRLKASRRDGYEFKGENDWDDLQILIENFD